MHFGKLGLLSVVINASWLLLATSSRLSSDESAVIRQTQQQQEVTESLAALKKTKRFCPHGAYTDAGGRCRGPLGKFVVQRCCRGFNIGWRTPQGTISRHRKQKKLNQHARHA
eukprot:TRINITY_DN29443_c0_g1_i1.p2 TRINITY_DN29443_c0_g1~~TRINITY_DN29443_c0_g1_i1.p2  ORF type:complete len:120 (-),score=13.89 TRINITY_DN29443_c0_g1_i1:28-366(-)